MEETPAGYRNAIADCLVDQGVQHQRIQSVLYDNTVTGISDLTLPSDDENATRGTGRQSHPIAGATRSGGSAWQSLARGARTQTDYLNGEIVLLGELHGVPTPVNRLLQQLAADAARAGTAPGSIPLATLVAQVERAAALV